MRASTGLFIFQQICTQNNKMENKSINNLQVDRP